MFEAETLLTAGVFLTNNFKGTAQMSLGAQPVLLPDPLVQHFANGMRIVRPLLLRAGMSIEQLNDPHGLAIPRFGIYSIQLNKYILTNKI